MKEDFERIYQYLLHLDRRFDNIDDKLSTKAEKSDIESLRNAIDGLYGQIDVIDSESAANRPSQTYRRYIVSSLILDNLPLSC